ncbi:MAG: STAS domain-containing protein [bacterium]|nr:STAS domain-containing protein [bacterium]
MQQQTFWQDDIFVVKLSGKMMGGMGTAGFHDDVKLAASEGCRRVAIDMEEVDWLNSWGVGLLVSAFTTLRNCGGQMILAGCGPKVMAVLRMTHFDSVFVFENDVNAALQTLAAPSD